MPRITLQYFEPDIYWLLLLFLSSFRSMERFFTHLSQRLLFIFCLVFTTVHLSAQEITVTCKIVDNKNEPVPFASVAIYQRTDTLKSEIKVADSSGMTSFILQKDVQYIVRISATGYLSSEKGIVANNDFLSFTIESVTKTLKEVEVISQKPLIRQEDDKQIIDAENLASSSTNAFEIVEKTPGLFVDQDGNIYLSSTTPATVHINGRELKMSRSDIASILKNLSPNSILQIEILRTPSAKYDASGSGGIVNVVLKKGVKIGVTGSVNGGMNQGKYGNQFLGVSINNNIENRRSYLNMNYNRRNSFERIITDRIFAADSILSQDALTMYPGRSYNLGYGLGYDVTEKWELDYDGRISFNHFDNNTENENIIRKISNGALVTSQLNNVNNKGNSFSLTQEVSSKYKIDTIGSEWEIDLSYNYFTNRSSQVFVTDFSYPVSYTYGGDGEIDGRRNFFIASTDLKKKLPKKITLEAGLKASFQQYKSVTDYYKESGGLRVKDTYRTNTYRYRENINAAYLQVSKTMGDIILKTGIRMENTNMKGRQIIPGDTTFSVSRYDLFPYIYLSKKVMTIAGYDLRAYLVYRRTLNRPGYEQLNPFPRYIDQFLTEIGNPSLRPQFTKNYEANISVNERPLLAIGYNDTKDIFSNVVYQSADSSQAFRTYDNVGTRKELYLRGLGAIPPGKRYFFVIGAQYNRNFYEGLYQNHPLSYKRGGWIFFTYHSFKIDKRSQISLHGFVRLKGPLQFYELSSFGALNTSINRHFFKQKFTVTLSVNDIFYTNKNDFTIDQPTVQANGRRYADSQRFGLNLRYNFGIRKKEEKNDIFNIGVPEKIN